MTDTNTAIDIALWNATGLSKYGIDSVLNYIPSTTIFFITETWLLPSSKYLTNWTQFHVYGTPRDNMPHLAKMGISLLINPSCPYPLQLLPAFNSDYTQYHLSCTIAETLIHCLYLPPSLDDTLAIEIIQSLPLTYPGISNTIICGDFNARLGSWVGDHDTNLRDYRLRDRLRNNGITIWNSSLAFGLPTVMRDTRTSIVDLFMSTDRLVSPEMHIHDDLSLNSDHKLMHLRFTALFPAPPAPDHPGRRLWRISRLNKQHFRDKFLELFAARVQPLRDELEDLVSNQPEREPDLEQLTSKLYESIYTSLDDSIGPKPAPPATAKWFWTPALQKAVDEREHCYRKWRRAIGVNKLTWWIRHQEARGKVKRAINQRRRETWLTFCTRMDTGDFTKATAQLKRIRRGRTMTPTFTDHQGPAAAAERMVAYLESDFAGSLLSRDRLLETRSTPRLPCGPFLDDPDPFTPAAVSSALKSIPSTKAPGIDHIRGDMVHVIAEELTPPLTALFRLCWRWSRTPTAWRVTQVVPIYKKGDPSDPTNY